MKSNFLFKKIFSIFLSVVLLVSTLYFGTTISEISASAITDEPAEQVRHVTKNVLAENDYNNAVIYDLTNADRVWDAQNALKDSSQAIFPVADPLGGEGAVLTYKQQIYEDGAVYLGADYTSASNVKSQAIQVTPGKIYNVKFDYYTTGTAELPLKLELTVGNTINQQMTSLTEGAVSIINTDSNANLTMSGWTTINTTITVPQDIDTDVYTYLILRVTYGAGSNASGAIYFDNVKVVEVSLTSNYICADTDFTDANDTEDDMYEHSQAFRSGADPLDATNKVLMKKSGYDVGGAVYLGMDYKDDTTLGAIANEAIEVKAGGTYTVQFDYYYDCSDYWKESPVYLTAGKTYLVDETKNPWDFKYGISYDSNIAVTVFTTQSYHTMTGWQTATFNITFPEDYNTTAYPYLMIYNNSGSELCELYIDNIRVREFPPAEALRVYDEQLQSNDYQDARTYDSTNEDRVWDAQNALKGSSQAIFPVADPLGGTGGALMYKQQIYEDGAVYLGADYTSTSSVKSQAIQVIPGETYLVKFDYYSTGTTGIMPLNVHLTVGNTIDNTMTSLTEGAVSVISIGSNTDLTMSGWATAQAAITVPEDIDTDVYTYLMLRVTYGYHTGAIYFDNTEVTVTAPVAVNYTIGDETNCEVFYDGIFNNAVFNTATDSVMWYSDEACTKSFNQSSIEDSDELQVFELYGVYENATAAFIKGDIDLNNIVNASDLATMRSWLLENQALSTSIGERADVNSDGTVNTADITQMEKVLAGNAMSDFSINDNALANYTIVTPNAAGYDYELVTSRINDLADLVKTANGGTNVDVIKEDNVAATEYEIIVGNAARTGVTTDLAENSYIVIPVGNKLYVNGGSESALGAALESLMGYIRSGNPINEDSFIAFEYIANTKLTNPALTVLSEDFNTNMAAGTMINAAASPYGNFFPNDACDWFLNDGREEEGTNTAFSSNNIWATNGSLIMDASGPTEITFTNAGVSDTRTAYVGAEIRGKAFTYGYAEMRAKLDVCNRVCPSFWLIGNSAGGTEEHYYEIDIFECFGAYSKENGMVKGSLIEYTQEEDGTYSAMELRANYELLNGVTSRYINGFSNDGEFHKYAVEWTEDYIYFIYDDVRVMRMQLAEGQFSREMTPVFTIYSGVDVVDGQVHTIDTTTETTDDEWANSSSFEIDYVKIYSKQFSN